MAKLRNPLLSLTATGTLGDHLSYVQNRMGAIARSLSRRRSLRRAGIKLPPSAGQLAQRALWSAGVAAWNAITPQEKAAWQVAADWFALTGFNLFMRDYIANPPPSWVDGSFGPITFTGTANTPLDDYDAALVLTPYATGAAVLDGAGHAVAIDYNDATYYHTNAPGSPDYRVQVRCLRANAGGYAGGPMIRHQQTSATAYVMYFDASNATWRIMLYNNGTPSVLASTSEMPPNGNRLLALEGAGTTITAFIDGTQVMQVTDATLTDAGRAAFAPFGPAGYAPMDDFQMIDTPPA